MPVSLEVTARGIPNLALSRPRRGSMGDADEPIHCWSRPHGLLRRFLTGYMAAFLAAFLGAGTALRACGFTPLSSTGVVPCTSFSKVAPAGTR